MHVEIVNEKDWPEIRRLMMESLADLPFYEGLEENQEKRHKFFCDYIDNEFSFYCKSGAGIVFCLKADEEDLVNETTENFNTTNHHADVVMAMTLRFPEGCTLRSGVSTEDFANFKKTKEAVHSLVEKHQERDDSRIWINYPDICERLQEYNSWYKPHAEKAMEETQERYAIGSHIFVSPQYRRMGVAAEGIQEAVRFFTMLSTAFDCPHVLVNTGVSICRIVLKLAGFEEHACINYKGTSRWILRLDMRTLMK